ncbi:winged helix-turn-helix domain-containing protein [Blastomonas fulva]|uniref:winged helix-turn-helix domain-containing protein n=1 Tax=Blastomonas fulva TaxID=1550728 RepID=UPI003F6FABF1
MIRQSFLFGPFQLQAHDRTLWREGKRIDLSARYLDVLILLIEARGDLVTKDRFMQEVWRGVPVTDEALTQAIRSLRKALGDKVSAPRFVETVPKFGYRFIAPVALAEGAERAMPSNADAQGDGLLRRRAFIATVIAGTSGAIIAGLVIGLIYGLLGAASPLAKQSGGSGISLVLVLALVSTVSAAAAGLGVTAGIAVTRLIYPPRWYWTVAGAALGGLMLGAFGHLVGTDAFMLLFGRELDRFAGAFEGAVIGTAIGVAMATGPKPWHPVVIAAVLGLLAGAIVAWLDGRMMAASLQELVLAFPGSRLQIYGLSDMLAERGMPAFGLASSAAVEGAIFCSAVVWALTRLDHRV